MTRKFKKAVFMGRFQPFHNGHMKVVHEAMKIADRILIIIGSVNKPPSSKNPLNYEQRYQLIHRALEARGFQGRFTIEPQKDYDYNEPKWISEVNAHVRDNDRVCLIGHTKDESSYYLKNFPNWEYVEVGNFSNLDATTVRMKLYNSFNSWIYQVPECNWKLIESMMLTPKFSLAADDYFADQKNKELWKKAPYPPTFITGDAVVVQSGHVLLIKRKYNPGKGLWAIPGGYLNQGETINDCILRELVEETSINLQDQILRRAMATPVVFGAPNRSGRGRIVTHASLIQLDDSKDLPKVTAGDDAEKAWWTPIKDLSQHNMFEDHYHIIMDLIRQ